MKSGVHTGTLPIARGDQQTMLSKILKVCLFECSVLAHAAFPTRHLEPLLAWHVQVGGSAMVCRMLVQQLRAELNSVFMMSQNQVHEEKCRAISHRHTHRGRHKFLITIRGLPNFPSFLDGSSTHGGIQPPGMASKPGVNPAQPER